VQRTGDTQTQVSVEYATADGTAINGSKYTAVGGTIVFRAGEITKTIVVPVLDNRLIEGSQKFQVNLSNPAAGAVLGARTNAIVTITDNDVGIQFQFATYLIAEDAGAVVIGIVRGDDSVLPVSVQFATTDLSATNGVDYIGATNTLSFAPQERLKLVPVPIMNNRFKQPNRTFRVTLDNPTGITLDSQKAATVIIVDNDPGFQFEFASYAVAEDAGVVRIAILRGTDETNSPVTVDFNTADVTANNGLNYSGTTDTLSFAPGETVKFVTVPILNDGLRQPGKIFRVSLGNPPGGAVLGTRKTATVSILDSDPGIGFELAGYSVWENTGDMTLTVLRGNSAALGLVTADYATSDLSAKAGLDYRAISGTLTFAQNETVKTITIPILRNVLVTNNSSFRVTLSNVTGGVALGRANTSVSIMNAAELGTFRAVAPPFDAALAIRRDGAINILIWNGGGQLQRADRPTGPWQMLTNASRSQLTRRCRPLFTGSPNHGR
jgi:hypothetical protein